MAVNIGRRTGDDVPFKGEKFRRRTFDGVTVLVNDISLNYTNAVGGVGEDCADLRAKFITYGDGRCVGRVLDIFKPLLPTAVGVAKE